MTEFTKEMELELKSYYSCGMVTDREKNGERVQELNRIKDYCKGVEASKKFDKRVADNKKAKEIAKERVQINKTFDELGKTKMKNATVDDLNNYARQSRQSLLVDGFSEEDLSNFGYNDLF